MRADAARKREQIVAAAIDELADLAQAARTGESFKLSLDQIAARAGVGIATLYRHFPTREALLAAVYHQELARLCDAAPELAKTGPADKALLDWMTSYLDFIESKRAMGDSLRAIVASGAVTQAETRQRVATAVSFFLEAGASTGVFPPGTPPDDVVAAMVGAAVTAQNHAQAMRLLTLLIHGLRQPI
ncbi:TetR/AcrR family transcriptional regulator [Kribbella antibiotica]|uniref:TetR/AcrR family transcriptional regulator n=1 Tax=Kribbella antibiotica TaxID=190195 RepID=A0A4R4YWD8_9ACTN|nr:TetR/AcrR family transcriptional regulator [Kribbella antibiotica]TDD49765.1 TetR/AcrR family transcriptional regulator [Kribbella antibiotica]